MIEFRQSTDTHALEIFRQSRHIGWIMWHPEKSPRLLMNDDKYRYLSLDELRLVLEKLEECLRA